MTKLPPMEGWTLVFAQMPRQFQHLLAERVDFSDPPEVYDFAIAEAMKSNEMETKRLIDSGFFEKVILTEGVILTEEACSLYHALTTVISNYDLRILQAVTNSQRVWPEEVTEWEMSRVLNILRSAAPNVNRLNILLQRFARAPYPTVRSQAVRLIGQAYRQESWFEGLMRDPDPRVRSNLLEVIGEAQELSPFLKGLVMKAAQDHHHRVQSTALFVLAKFGDASAATRIVDLLSHQEENFRKAARWAIRALAALRTQARRDASAMSVPPAPQQSPTAAPLSAAEPAAAAAPGTVSPTGCESNIAAAETELVITDQETA